MSQETVNWKGASGSQYTYSVFELGTSFKDLPGNYGFAKRNSNGLAVPAYVGETGSLADRLNQGNHEKLPCVRGQGADLVCVHVNQQGRQSRLDEETDLRNAWKPACNDQ
jgi:hypothetical protein